MVPSPGSLEVNRIDTIGRCIIDKRRPARELCLESIGPVEDVRRESGSGGPDQDEVIEQKGGGSHGASLGTTPVADKEYPKYN